MATSIVRLECICRKTSVGPEQRFCYGISLVPGGGRMAEIINSVDPSYLKGPDNKGLEILSREETLVVFKEYEKQGYATLSGLLRRRLLEVYVTAMQRIAMQ